MDKLSCNDMLFCVHRQPLSCVVYAIIALLLFRLTMTSSYVVFIFVLVLHRSNRKINSELPESVVGYTSHDMEFCPAHENSLHITKTCSDSDSITTLDAVG
jgi:hypothetical protein